MKTCRKCDRELPLDMFYKRNNIPSGRQSTCKECQCKGRVKYTKSHETARRTLNISDSIYEELMKVTHCQGCGIELKRKCIDHDHKTGKVRGVLCHNCNTSLGLLKDDLTTLRNLIKYLET